MVVTGDAGGLAGDSTRRIWKLLGGDARGGYGGLLTCVVEAGAADCEIGDPAGVWASACDEISILVRIWDEGGR